MSVLVIVGPKMKCGRVTCCPLVNHGDCDDRTDRRTDGTPDRYITLSA